MKLAAVVLVLFISGCSTFLPVERNFPDPVPELTKKCPDLKKVDESTTSIIDLLKVVVENYKLYYACANKVEGWQEWYKEQKQIFEQVD